MLYRIGELAELAHVTKRTVDYYTNLGLLKAERTASNYRYYSKQALEDLRFIEECKHQNLSLQEIKEALVKRNEMKPDIVNQANNVANQIHVLKENIEDLIPLIKNLDENDRKLITNRLSPETVTLIQSLLLLLG